MNTIPQPSAFAATRRRLALPVASLFAALALTQSLSATPLYWDTNGVTANSGTTASGGWDGVNAFWNTDSTGTGGTPQAVTLATDDLFFSSGTGLTGASAVVITGAVTANSITFEEGTVTLSGTSTPSLTLGAGGLTFNNGTGANVISAPVVLGANTTFTNNDNSDQTISGGLGGAFNLNVNATSTGGIVLSGNSTGYSGTTTLTAGALTARGDGTVAFTTLGTGNIVLNGGTLRLKSEAGGNNKNIITGNGTTGNNVTIGSAATTIDVNNSTGSGFQNTGNSFVFNDLSIGTGQLNITGGNSYALKFTGATTLTGNATFSPTTAGLIITGAIGDGGNGYGITKIGSGTLTLGGASTYTGTTSILAGTVTLAAPATSGTAGSLGNSTGAVLLGDTSGSNNVTIQSSQTGVTSIARDMIVQSGNTGVVTIWGNASSNYYTDTISGNIQLGSTGGTGHGVTVGSATNNSVTFTGIISDPAGLSGPAAPVTAAAGGVAIFSGNNTFAGGLIINGSVRMNNNNGAGTGTITINNGASLGGPAYGGPSGITIANDQIWNGSFTSGTSSGPGLTTTGSISLTNDVTLSMNLASYTATGVISDSVLGANHSLTFRQTSSSYGATWALSGANTFGGGVQVIGSPTQNASVSIGGAAGTALGTGQVSLSNSTTSLISLTTNQTMGSLSSVVAAPTFTAGTGGTNGTQALVFTGGGGTGAAGTATISGGAITAVTITNYGKDYTSAPTITLSNPGGSGTITSSFGSSSIALGNKTLTLAGTNASPATYAGVISGSGGNLVKNGSGTQILTGSNSYTGTTTVSGGVLNVSGGGTVGTGTTNGVTVNGGELAYNSSVDLFKTISLSSGIVSGTGNLSGAITMSGGVLSNSGTLGGGVTVNGGLVTSTGTAGAVALNAGGGINPADTGVAGTFTADSLTWNSNDSLSGIRFDLGLNSAASDTINLAGAFTKGTGSTFIFDFGDLGYAPSVTYTLLTFGSTDFSVGDFSATGIAGTFILNGNDLSYMTAAIPEPATYAAILGALALAGVVYRRRRSRSA